MQIRTFDVITNINRICMAIFENGKEKVTKNIEKPLFKSVDFDFL